MIGNPGHPGVADQLWVEGQQLCWFLRIAAGCGFPVQKAADRREPYISLIFSLLTGFSRGPQL